MWLQSGQNSCGPTCVANALLCLGPRWKKISEKAVLDKVRSVGTIADTDPAAGAIESQIMRALNAYGVKHETLSVHNPAAAVAALRGNLLCGRPALLAVDNDDHWIVAAGALGAGFLIVDSANDDLVSMYGEDRLASRWKSAGDPAHYYAIIIGRKP